MIPSRPTRNLFLQPRQARQNAQQRHSTEANLLLRHASEKSWLKSMPDALKNTQYASQLCLCMRATPVADKLGLLLLGKSLSGHVVAVGAPRLALRAILQRRRTLTAQAPERQPLLGHLGRIWRNASQHKLRHATKVSSMLCATDRLPWHTVNNSPSHEE